jgi:hypothetical protein
MTYMRTPAYKLPIVIARQLSYKNMYHKLFS